MGMLERKRFTGCNLIRFRDASQVDAQPKLTGCRVSAPNATHQPFVGFSEQAEAERKAFAESQDAVVKCSERCLYQSAKWYATRS